MGYANRVITQAFPEVSDGPDDKIWVAIRNPRLALAPEITSATQGSDGEQASTNAMLAALIVGWRVYDASAPVTLDADGNDVSEPAELLPLPATPELVAKLPAVIYIWLGEQLRKAFPQMPTGSQEGGTSSGSSPLPSPSTTEPGPEASPSPAS